MKPSQPPPSTKCPRCGLSKKDMLCICQPEKSLSLEKKNQGEVDDSISSEELYRDSLSRARESMEKKKYQKAKRFFLDAIAVKPESEEASQGAQEAEEKIRRDHFERLVQEGRQLAAEEKWDRAQAKLETALIFCEDEEVQAEVDEIRQKSLDSEFHLYKAEGEIFFEAGAYKEAAECWHKALVLKSSPEINKLYQKAQEKLREVSTIIEEAQTLADRGEWDKALKEIEKAYLVYPENQDALVTTAFFSSHREEYRDLWKEGKKSEKYFLLINAWSCYRSILALSPDDRRARLRLLWVQIKLILACIGLAFLGAWIMSKIV